MDKNTQSSFTKQEINDINVTLQLNNNDLVKTIYDKTQLIGTLENEIYKLNLENTRMNLENTRMNLEIKELNETINKLQKQETQPIDIPKTQPIDIPKTETHSVYFNYLTHYFRN